MEKYSVLMSVYYKENPKYFDQALASIVHQTIMPNEIVIVEDGSLTDELYSVINSYCSNYPNLIHRVKIEQNLGLGLALKAGLSECKNELVARMDTDDIAIMDRCEIQLKFFNDHPNVDILGGQIVEFINDTDNVVGKRIVPLHNNELMRYMKRRCPFNHMTVMFRKSCILQSGNYRDFPYNEDYDLWIRVANNNYCFANIPDVLTMTRVGPEMYARRGGIIYFKSEYRIQKLLLKYHMIGLSRFTINVVMRFVLQVLLTNKLRSLIYQSFARY